MTKNEALTMCLEYIETNAHERKYVRHAIKQALADIKQDLTPVQKPRLDQGADYERGFIDGMQKQMQSSVDKAVNAMSQPAPVQEPVAGQCRFLGAAWLQCDPAHVRMVLANPQEWKGYEARYLYTSPPAQRKPLTDEEWQSIADTLGCFITRGQKDAIEAALGIKENT